MTFLQIWHHVYGRELLPRPIKLFFRRVKAAVKRPFTRTSASSLVAPFGERPTGRFDVSSGGHTLIMTVPDHVPMNKNHPFCGWLRLRHPPLFPLSPGLNALLAISPLSDLQVSPTPPHTCPVTDLAKRPLPNDPMESDGKVMTSGTEGAGLLFPQ